MRATEVQRARAKAREKGPVWEQSKALVLVAGDMRWENVYADEPLRVV